MNIRLVHKTIYGAGLFCAFALSGVLASVSSAADATTTKTTDKTDKPAKIDLNTATDKQLQELPGIGEVYSKKIIAARPLKTFKDLSKLGIPGPTIEKIKPLATILAGRPGGKLKPPKKGMVWVNTDTKIYHKDDSPFYGNTKNGTWMTEADAIKAGNKLTQ